MTAIPWRAIWQCLLKLKMLVPHGSVPVPGVSPRDAVTHEPSKHGEDGTAATGAHEKGEATCLPLHRRLEKEISLFI